LGGLTRVLGTLFVSERDPRCRHLRRRLHAFYAECEGYEAFESVNWKPEFWAPIRADIEQVAAKRQCRVLEVGAGRTGFAGYLGEDLRRRVFFAAQDVTNRNAEHLSSVADRTYIGEITAIRERYDVVFGTFMFEHLTCPEAALRHLLAILNPGGILFIACPRYDFPFYISPSARHLSPPRQLAIGVWLMLKRLRVLCGGEPQFLIHLDPAVFHRPWFRDADAVHWVSLWDLKRVLSKVAVIARLRLSATGLRARFWAHFLLMFVRITPRGTCDGQTVNADSPQEPGSEYWCARARKC
jgi:SAM-dependent methyltransferase